MSNRRREINHAASRRHFPQTLVLLDYTAEEEVPAEPAAAAAAGRHRAPNRGWRDWRAVIAATGVMLIVIVGSVIGGSIAMGSSPAKTKVATSQGTMPRIVVVTTVPSPSPSPVATVVRHKASPPPKPVTRVSSPPASPTTAPSKPAPPAIVVTFKVIANWGNGFQAKVDVTNNGSTAISGWQIVVALPLDQFTGWWNSSGYASNGVLLLSPPSWQPSVKPHGGTWSVYFNANGEQTTPVACAFNGVACAK